MGTNLRLAPPEIAETTLLLGQSQPQAVEQEEAQAEMDLQAVLVEVQAELAEAHLAVLEPLSKVLMVATHQTALLAEEEEVLQDQGRI